MFKKAVKLTIVVMLGLMCASALGKDFEVKQQWPKPVLVFGAGRDHVIGHQEGQIYKLAKSKDMYQCYREPVVVRTKSGRIVALCHAGNRHAWPERSGQDLAVTFSDDGRKTWSRPRVAAGGGARVGVRTTPFWGGWRWSSRGGRRVGPRERRGRERKGLRHPPPHSGEHRGPRATPPCSFRRGGDRGR